MNRFFLLFRKIHLFLLFILIEIAAIAYYSDYSIYTNAKIINASSFMVRGVNDILVSTEEYINLKEDNNLLLEEIVALQNELEHTKQNYNNLLDTIYNQARDTVIINDSTTNFYSYFPTKIANNSISKQHNYITISSGSNDGMERDMALISNGTVVGYILDCSKNYSVAISILNRDFKTSGKDKTGKYFGSIRWNGKSYKEVTLEDIPKYGEITIGDTIITTEFSARFPSGLKIGTVKSFEKSSEINHEATIELFLDMSKLSNIVAIKNKNIQEIMELESKNIINND